MAKLRINTFHKSVSCPSSEKLLAFQNNETPLRERDKITVHLRFCEFCAAEAELYSRFPQAEDTVEKAEIPAALYELAEALLKKKDKNHDVLDEWLEDIEFNY